MSPDTAEHDGVRRIVLIESEGSLDAYSAPGVRARIATLTSAGVSCLVIDLAEATFVDSAGLAVPVSALKRSPQAGGDVKPVWPAAEHSRRVLRLAHVDRAFDIAEDIDAAMARF
jgi:anti-sigma B factor antagonist